MTGNSQHRDGGDSPRRKREPAHVFGPVPSRRLGRSLGIDPVPLKTCNWNCVYCQLGRSRPMTNRREIFVPVTQIAAELRSVLAKRAGEEIDWITVVASGEPLLYAGLEPLLREIKALSRWPLAVITNGSLLSRPEIRRELLAADAVLPSLDAGTTDLYRRINRPHPGVPFEAHVRGLEVFRTEFSGRLWVEVMLLNGLNDSEEALRPLADVLVAIRPDAIHLTTPTRPPVEPWVRPADREGILRAQAILGEAARVVHPAQGSFDLSAEEGQDAVIEAIIAILKRHPVRSDDLRAALAERGDGQTDETISRLQSSGRVRLVERLGVAFWTHADSVFPEQSSRPINHAGSGESRSESDC